MSLHLPVAMVHALIAVVALIALNTLITWIGALVHGTWSWHAVGDFVASHVLPYVGGLIALAALAVIQPSMGTVFYTSAGAVALKFVAKVISAVHALGVPVADAPGTGASTPK